MSDGLQSSEIHCISSVLLSHQKHKMRLKCYNTRRFSCSIISWYCSWQRDDAVGNQLRRKRFMIDGGKMKMNYSLVKLNDSLYMFPVWLCNSVMMVVSVPKTPLSRCSGYSCNCQNSTAPSQSQLSVQL